MSTSPIRILAVSILTLAPTICTVAFADDRVELHGLITAAPLPAGYESKRQDFQTTDGAGNTLILLSKPGDKSRVQVTIDNKKLATKEDKVAAFKGYVNGIHGMFTKRGYAAIEIETPDSQTLDPEKRLDLRMKLKKGSTFLYVDAEVFFTDHGYTVWSVTPNETERETLKAWLSTVRAK